MSTALGQILQKVQRTSVRGATVAFAALLLATTVGFSLQQTGTAKALNENWTLVKTVSYPDGKKIDIAACKVYHNDPVYGPLYTAKIWVANTTNHHRNWQWQQLRPDQANPLQLHVIAEEGPKDEWWLNMTRRDIEISAWYSDMVLVRLIHDNQTPPVSHIIQMPQINNCY